MGLYKERTSTTNRYIHAISAYWRVQGWILPLAPGYSTLFRTVLFSYDLGNIHNNRVVVVITNSTNFILFITYGFKVLITSLQYLSARN